MSAQDAQGEDGNDMGEEQQRTLAAPFAFSGTGLHTGAEVWLEVLPVLVNT